MDKLKELIKDGLDPDELVEILNLDTEQLMYYLDDCIEECQDKFQFLLGPEDEGDVR